MWDVREKRIKRVRVICLFFFIFSLNAYAEVQTTLNLTTPDLVIGNSDNFSSSQATGPAGTNSGTFLHSYAGILKYTQTAGTGRFASFNGAIRYGIEFDTFQIFQSFLTNKYFTIVSTNSSCPGSDQTYAWMMVRLRTPDTFVGAMNGTSTNLYIGGTMSYDHTNSTFTGIDYFNLPGPTLTGSPTYGWTGKSGATCSSGNYLGQSTGSSSFDPYAQIFMGSKAFAMITNLGSPEVIVGVPQTNLTNGNMSALGDYVFTGMYTSFDTRTSQTQKNIYLAPDSNGTTFTLKEATSLTDPFTNASLGTLTCTSLNSPTTGFCSGTLALDGVGGTGKAICAVYPDSTENMLMCTAQLPSDTTRFVTIIAKTVKQAVLQVVLPNLAAEVTNANDSTTVTVTLKNLSSRAITSLGNPSNGALQLAAPWSNTNAFGGGNGTCGTSLKAYSTCTFDVTYNPSSVGANSRVLRVAYDNGVTTVNGTSTLLGAAGLTSIDVTGSASFSAGSPQAFTATATFSDASTQNITSVATWSSNHTSIATVSSTGSVTGLKGGAVTISATFGTIDGTKNVVSSPFSWIGGGGNANWNNGANWAGGSAPTTNDVAIFDNSCSGADCNVTVNADIDVKGIDIKSTYTGTITQASTKTITVGSSNWSQAGGTFAGGDSGINVNGFFSLTGGTFTSTSGTLYVGYGSTGDDVDLFTLGSGATFTHNSGTLWIGGYYNNGGTETFVLGQTLELYNLTIATYYTTVILPAGKTINIRGDLQQGYTSGNRNSTINGPGTWNLYGNLIITNEAGGGTATVNWVGTGNKTYTYVGGMWGGGANLKINKSSGTVTPADGTTDLVIGKFELAQGSFTAPSGTLKVAIWVGHEGGNTTTFTLASGTTFTHNSGTLQMSTGFHDGGNDTFSLGDDTLELHHFTVDGYGDNVSLPTGKTINIRGNYTQGVNAALSGPGTYNLYGNLIGGGNWFGGDAVINWISTGNKTYTTNGGLFPNLKLNKSSGTVTPSAGGMTMWVKSLELVQGSFTAPETLGIGTSMGSGGGNYNALTIASGATFTHNSGTLVLSASHWWGGTQAIITLGDSSLDLNNLTVSGSGNVASLAANKTINIYGNFTLGTNGAGLNGPGMFNIYGNCTITAGSYDSSSAPISFLGTGNQMWTGGGQMPKGNVTVNKASGTVTLASNITLNSSGQDFTLTSGTVDLDGFTLAVDDVFTIGASGTLVLSDGDYTYGSLVNNGTVLSVSPFTWTGGGANANWNTGGNWYGGAAPGSSDVAKFNALCTQCNATINADIDVKGFLLSSDYTGTITQAATKTITVGTSGWSQAAGTFNGSNADMTITGQFMVTGGTFNATSGTFTYPTTAAGYISTDTTTQGSWDGVYGSDGYWIEGVASALPGYATVDFSGASTYTWDGATSNTKALQIPSSSDRIAACWYSGGSYTFTVTFSDTNMHQMSLYFLDWDAYGPRTGTVKITDADTNETLVAAKNVTSFTDGKYFIYNVRGHIKVTVANTNSNMTMSGIFFDAP